jgi:hypothetical protein
MLDERNPGGINVSRLSRNTHAGSASGGALCYVSETCNSIRACSSGTHAFSVLVVPRDRASGSTKANKLARDENETSEPSLLSLQSSRIEGLFNFIIRFGLRLREAENFRFMGRLGQNPPNLPTRAHLHVHSLRFRYPSTMLDASFFPS